METFKAPFKGRSLLNWIDWTPKEINTLLDLAFQVKAESHRGEVHQRFLGKTIALIVVMHFVAPAVLSLIFHFIFKKIGLVKDEYLALDKI